MMLKGVAIECGSLALKLCSTNVRHSLLQQVLLCVNINTNLAAYDLFGHRV
jgi:hypothetical protein